MPTHDIIDNRQQKLVDNINQILHSSEAAHFAVGYFFPPALLRSQLVSPPSNKCAS